MSLFYIYPLVYFLFQRLIKDNIQNKLLLVFFHPNNRLNLLMYFQRNAIFN